LAGAVARGAGTVGTYPATGGSGSAGSQKTCAMGILTWNWERLGALRAVGISLSRIRVPNCH